MLRDRGTIKWTSLMLPEHVELLKQLWAEDKKFPRPTLDEQELEYINLQLTHAFNLTKEVNISVYEQAHLNHYCGKIISLDKNMGTITLSMDGMKKIIPFSDIISLN